MPQERYFEVIKTDINSKEHKQYVATHTPKDFLGDAVITGKPNKLGKILPVPGKVYDYPPSCMMTFVNVRYNKLSKEVYDGIKAAEFAAIRQADEAAQVAITDAVVNELIAEESSVDSTITAEDAASVGDFSVLSLVTDNDTTQDLKPIKVMQFSCGIEDSAIVATYSGETIFDDDALDSLDVSGYGLIFNLETLRKLTDVAPSKGYRLVYVGFELPPVAPVVVASVVPVEPETTLEPEPTSSDYRTFSTPEPPAPLPSTRQLRRGCGSSYGSGYRNSWR